MTSTHSRTSRPKALPTARSLGARFEEIAEAWCRRQGWRVIARNVTCRRGEIDLIALDGETLVFIEVRQRRSARFGSAIESVTATKQQRISTAIRYWLAGPVGRQHSHRAMRCDLLAFSGEDETPEWLANAFDLAPW